MPPITPQDIDRLVDDELSPAERRELLAALESDPNGWRRCALAFVESQSLRSEFRGLVGVAPVSQPAVLSQGGSSPPRSAIGWVAIAASVLLAYGLGAYAHTGVGPSADQHGGQLAESPLPEPPAQAPGAPPESALSHRTQPADSPDPDVVTFWTQDEQGNRQSLRTRLVDADELNASLGVDVPSAASPDVRRRFEQRGLRFESRRRYAPLHMENGRTLVVPVEDMRVAPMPIEFL